MKAGLKKLRTCAFSKARASREFFSTQTQYNRRLVCDHPEMKKDWSEETCVDCSSYRNRNRHQAAALKLQRFTATLRPRRFLLQEVNFFKKLLTHL